MHSKSGVVCLFLPPAIKIISGCSDIVFIQFIFSSTEQKVSSCDQSMSVVRSAASTIALKAYSCTTGPILTRNLLGSVGVTCRLKIAKISLIRNPRWTPWQPS